MATERKEEKRSGRRLVKQDTIVTDLGSHRFDL